MKANRSLGFAVSVAFVAILLLGGGSARADFTFGEPNDLGPTVNGPNVQGGPHISRDGLELYFYAWREDGLGRRDIWVVQRTTPSEPWGQPTNLGAVVNTDVDEVFPDLSSDGGELYFASDGPGGFGQNDIWVARRATMGDPWRKAMNLGPPVNTSAGENQASLSDDGLALYFASNRPGGHGSVDLWVTTRATQQDPWTDPVNLGVPINSPGRETTVHISSDDLILFFASDRPGGPGDLDVYMARRSSRDQPWGEPVLLGPPVSTPFVDRGACLNYDDSTLLFGSERPGGIGLSDLWQVPIIPVVDLNGDAKVGFEDLKILVECWGQDAPAADIAPPPFGDGMVDEKDVEVLMQHWGQEFHDPALSAHWKLDEAAGTTAADSAAANNGMVMGNPIWQPAGGVMAGALLFDGADDYVRTEPALDPSSGPFSVFAWIKGGAPGQVVLSQRNGVNWLMAAAPQGTLLTALRGSGRTSKMLACPVVITDGAWHRVGFACDGASRTLYVDGAEAAQDTQATLIGSCGGLYIGAGSTLAPGTFWSGLIDDVRIYNRAVKPTPE